MPKIDERAIVPPLDAAALERLRGALDAPGVASAWLIGSQATGKAGPLSDVDIGVFADPGLGAGARRDLRRRLLAAASAALGTDEVDLVLLDAAPPPIAFRALRDGVRLVDRDPVGRVRLETAAAIAYLDTAELRAEQIRGIRGRIREDGLGRR